MPEQNYILYDGLANSDWVVQERLYQKEDIYNDNCSDAQLTIDYYDFVNNAADYVAYSECQQGFTNKTNIYGEPSWFPARIKDKFIFYCYAEDMQNDGDFVNANSSNMDAIEYELYRVADNNGTFNNLDPLLVYSADYDISNSGSIREQSVGYQQGYIHHEKIDSRYDFYDDETNENSVKKLVKETGGVGLNMELKDFPDGL